jgi:hypothetical protein
MLPAARLLHIHNETNHSATNKFKSADDANPTAMHKQHHHCLPHALNALGTMFISLLDSPSKQPSLWGGDVGTAHINSGAGHSQSSKFHFSKQQPGKHVPTAMKLTAFQHQQHTYPWK